MRCSFSWLFALSLLGAASVVRADDRPPNPRVEITYIKPTKAELLPIHDRLKSRQVLERLASFLYPVKLPVKFKISTAECGGINKPFNRRDGVVICYELIARIRQAAVGANPDNVEAQRIAIVGAVTQTVLYRTALGLLDVLDLPVWGRYTDAADKIAGIVMLRFGGPQVAAITMNGATAFFFDSGKTWTGSDFAETRSPTVQRFFNYACLAFGSDPATFLHYKGNDAFLLRAGFIGNDGEPNPGVTDVENYCTYEFVIARRDFIKLMGPHIDEAKLNSLDSFVIFEGEDF